MTRAKSLLEVKDGLELPRHHRSPGAGAARASRGARIPLLLMNSFATRDDTLAALEPYAELAVDGLPLDFLQGRCPSCWRTAYAGELAGGPRPGMGAARPRRGVRRPRRVGPARQLLERGYEYVFLSNSDNLGAVLEPRILGWFARRGLPFASEVVDRTEGDKKGGHLARRRSDGRLRPARDRPGARGRPGGLRGHLRPPLLQLQQRLAEPAGARARAKGDGVLELPMIVNRKTVDPRDSSSPEVLQLETAMGAAIGVFDGAGAGAFAARARSCR